MICFLLFIFRLLKSNHHQEKEHRGNATPRGSPISAPFPDVHERKFLRWKFSSHEDTPWFLQSSLPVVIEVVNVPHSQIK
ncbi:hypothetical protein SADUNF_Sadunf11G0039500 [Salix dunnii]|uniref:Uncharacterized protein n=1 Tax=Salix dunnii TaxID=1413687 RepID=A0A835JMF1_9ROSI|nr:hypothetical protein SADUNF_Sadunf11G0039500 [Salix dunnii]